VNRVVDFEQKDKGRKEHSAIRGAYVAPKLKVFGPVGSLTQAGSMGGPEGNPNGSMTMA
jgi:hypothetical protein